MALLVYIFSQLVYYLLSALQLMMLARAVVSWVLPDDDNAFTRFVTGVTEPLITPVRMLLERFEFVQELPIDISFFVTCLLLLAAQSLLPTVTL